MKIACTPVVMDRSELEEKLKKPGLLNVNRLLIRGKEITNIELKYVEYLILEYRLLYRAGIWERITGKAGSEIEHRVYLLGNGTTGSVSFMDVIPKLENKDIPKSQIQTKDYGEVEMTKDARSLAMRLGRKLVGRRFPRIELVKAESIYRPFWAVYYGTPRKKDGAVLCSPLAADGFVIKS